jgi:hypothetical protein
MQALSGLRERLPELAAAYSERGVDYWIREPYAVLDPERRPDRPAVVACREPNTAWESQPRDARPRLVDAPAVSKKDNLVVSRTRLRHPGKRPRGSEQWQLAPSRRYRLSHRTFPCAARPLRARTLSLGRGRLLAYLGGRRRNGWVRAYAGGSRRSRGQGPLAFGGKRGLVSRWKQAHTEDPDKCGETQKRKRCRDRDSPVPGGLPTVPGGLPRFNPDRRGPGIIRQRGAGPCSEIGVHKDELGTNRPDCGLLGLHDGSDRG